MRAVMNSKQLLFAMAALVLAVVVTPVALAGAAGGAKQAPVAKTVKQLKKQVTALRQQAAALQQRLSGVEDKRAPATLPPNGPAGGDLTGIFPNPVIGPNAVAAAEIQANAVGVEEIQKDGVGAEEIQANAVGASELAGDSIDAQKIKVDAVQAEEIANNAVGRDEITNKSIGPEDLGLDSVGASALTSANAVIGEGVTISAGAPDVATVTCPNDQMAIGGGFAWSDQEPSTILASAPAEIAATTTWVVEAMVPTGSNTLFPWVSCLAP